MKTGTRQTLTKFLSMLLATVMLSGLVTLQAAAEPSMRSFETLQRERKRDFEKYIKGREFSSEKEVKAAEILRQARAKSLAQQLENEKNYRKKMKRYSMEEVEALDRADEERLARQASKSNQAREAFLRTREREREIENKISPVDPYRELDIDMTRPPETKVSHSGSSSDGP